MDSYSSGEELVVKIRKPYTITKQRERWTEEEHNRFLEALKLYGRAWQRIEEHIGTKTAVQIRSHAQKFFTKLEREAILKGVPTGHALDIEIPPPRPKRKPNNPYPRKTVAGAPTLPLCTKDGKMSTTFSSLHHGKTTLDLEKEPFPAKQYDDGNIGNAIRHYEKDNCSEVFTLLETTSCASPCSTNKNFPSSSESHVIIQAKGLQADKSDSKQLFQDSGSFKTTNIEDSCNLHEASGHGKRIDELKQSKNADTLPNTVMQASQNYPRHVPVHILDGSLGMSRPNVSPDMLHESMFHKIGVHEHPNLIMKPVVSATSEHDGNTSRSSVLQSFPCFHSFFTPIHNHNDYHSFMHVSSTFSSHIASALLQNPAAHAAASFAATLWPCVNMEAPAEFPTGAAGEFQSRQINLAPSMETIVAATLVAATSWWAAHGLLPSCAPYPGFACSPTSASANLMNGSKATAANSLRRENSSISDIGGQQLEPENSEPVQEQHSASKSPTLPTSDSEASEGAKLIAVGAATETAQIADAAELQDSNKSINRKQVDRSSCGSNTTSSSEVEADASEKHTKGKEENQVKDKEETKELDASHPFVDLINRRCRSACNINDSWKEVSEEGRLAFQALFSREVLPQFFSARDLKNKGKKNVDKDREGSQSKDEDGLPSNLNCKIWDACSQNCMEDNASLLVDYKDGGLLNMGLGAAKLKARRTGFKPYKRCSVVTKDSRISANSQDEEKCPKRLRLEGEASTYCMA